MTGATEGVDGVDGEVEGVEGLEGEVDGVDGLVDGVVDGVLVEELGFVEATEFWELLEVVVEVAVESLFGEGDAEL